jgi:hypothetical protein
MIEEDVGKVSGEKTSFYQNKLNQFQMKMALNDGCKGDENFADYLTFYLKKMKEMMIVLRRINSIRRIKRISFKRGMNAAGEGASLKILI